MITITYKNVGSTRADFPTSASNVHVYNDAGNTYKPYDDNINIDHITGRVILSPGESRVWHEDVSPQPSTDTNIFVRLSDLGAIREATWGFTISSGKVIPIAPDTKDPQSET